MSYAEQYDPQEGIAIVGMAGRFPGARNVDELWRNLLAGRESISRFTADELEPAHPEDMAVRDDPGYVRARGVLDGVDQFDDAFFGFSPAEAALLDPQQRLFLQAAWAALEHAGHDPARLGGPIGVYAGGTANSYYLNNLQSRRDLTDRLGLLTTQMANQGHYLATRTAYKLDLKGPALNIHTACSTSLVAVCTAVQALQSFQCDMALAGGVSVSVPQKRGYLHQEGSILSPDGHCRAFDAAAAGTVFSNGLGVVVLRRLQDALADGDTIYAVIKGAALNNDGHHKLSFTAPSVDGQAEVVALAQALAGIDPDTISYVEAHGTGTALGDPIEIAGLTQAFRAGGATRNGSCAIGSLKTNIGHLDAAAGVAGLIKTALALHHRTLPASLHLSTPNPKLELERTPFFVNDSQRAWPQGPTPRRAGVSSFGVGGTNAHVVLEEAPEAARVPTRLQRASADALLLLSGRDEAALERQRLQWLKALEADELPDWHDLTRTLQEGRRAFARRAAWPCRDRQEALRALSEPVASAAASAHPLRVAFLLPGQGAQKLHMGRSLYAREPVFRHELDACAERLRPFLDRDLRELLFPEAADDVRMNQLLAQTACTQPALFALEWSLACVWQSWGVQAQALLGHSVGEFVAAALAGTFTRDDALELVARRAALMQALPKGSMLAVRASVEQLQPLLTLTPQVGIAALNAPQMTVLSGETEAIARLAGTLQAGGTACRPLATSHAFHSPMMEPVVQAFRELVQATPRRAPRLPWISSLTGAPVDDEQAQSPDHWARQLREPVQFMAGLGHLLQGEWALLEVGPGRALSQLVRRQGRPPAQDRPVLSSMPEPGAADERRALLDAAARLWCAGADADWSAIQPGPWRRVALPTYPFAPQRRWVDPAPPAERAPPAVTVPVQAPTPPVPVPVPVPVPGPAEPVEGAPLAAAPLVPAAPAAISTSTPFTPMSSEPSAALIARLQQLFADLSGLASADVRPEAHFLELGLDSLSLTQASQALQRQFGCKVPMRVLLEDCTCVQALAAHLAPQLPPEAAPGVMAAPVGRPEAEVVAPVSALAPTPSSTATSAQRLAPAINGVAQALPPALEPTAAAAPAGAAIMPTAQAAPWPAHALPAAAEPWYELFARQLSVMGQQLELMRLPHAQAQAQAQALALAQAPSALTAEARPPTTAAAGVESAQVAGAAPAPAPTAPALPAEPSAPATPAFGPFRPLHKSLGAGLSESQQQAVKAFVERYSARTAGSKAATQQQRRHLADPRSVAGFRLAWKELVYPIVSVRSSGARLWDVDGHEYIDITNGFGMILLGHNAALVREAVQRQLETGYEIGPQTLLAGEVAQAICEMVGMDRAAFCATGSEAVMAALRMARTVTGRDTVVVFQGAYHGIFDEVLMRPGRAVEGRPGRPVPIAPGIPAAMADNLVVLEYGSPQALRTIQALGTQVAAVMVEPVQSRRPELQPREFLQELRRLTTESGAALVFDEVVTGFRVHPGGAQAVFGVRADIATYGKVIGGGLPIGVVAGSARFLDALDGGAWQYGDASAPEVGVTFFAGTFVRHPLALAAARAVLAHLKAAGPELQRELNLRTTRLVEQLQAVARQTGAPLRVVHFASWFCLQLPAELPLAPLFFAAMRLRGIHVWEGRPCFLTTAHGEAELRAIVAAVRESLAEMQALGFLPAAKESAERPHAALAPDAEVPPVAGARKGRDREGRQAWFLPDPARPGKFLQIRSPGVGHG